MLEDLKQVPKKVWPCRVRELAATLSPDDAKILIAAAENPDWSIIGLSQALKKKGLTVSESPIKKHRSKACSCFIG